MLSFVALGYFAQSPLLIFPVLALLLFLAVFVAVTVRTLRSDKSVYADIARLPLEEPQGHSRQEVRRG